MSMDPTAIAAELFGQMEKGWNTQDGDAFAEPFTDDVDFIDTRGFHHHGHDEVASSHAMILSTKFKDTSVHYEVADARQLGPGCILAHAKATMTSTTGAFPEGHARLSIVALEVDGGWKITALHNTMVST